MSDDQTEGRHPRAARRVLRHLDAIRFHAMIGSIAASIFTVVALFVLFGFAGAFVS